MIALAPAVVIPPRDIVEAMQRAQAYLWYDVQQAVGSLSLTATSWWRTREHNALVGGEPDSQHLVGTAIDLAGRAEYYPTVKARLWWSQAFNEGDHLHVQLYPKGAVSDYVRRLAR